MSLAAAIRALQFEANDEERLQHLALGRVWHVYRKGTPRMKVDADCEVINTRGGPFEVYKCRSVALWRIFSELLCSISKSTTFDDCAVMVGLAGDRELPFSVLLDGNFSFQLPGVTFVLYSNGVIAIQDKERSDLDLDVLFTRLRMFLMATKTVTKTTFRIPNDKTTGSECNLPMFERMEHVDDEGEWDHSLSLQMPWCEIFASEVKHHDVRDKSLKIHVPEWFMTDLRLACLWEIVNYSLSRYHNTLIQAMNNKDNSLHSVVDGFLQLKIHERVGNHFAVLQQIFGCPPEAWTTPIVTEGGDGLNTIRRQIAFEATAVSKSLAPLIDTHPGALCGLITFDDAATRYYSQTLMWRSILSSSLDEFDSFYYRTLTRYQIAFQEILVFELVFAMLLLLVSLLGMNILKEVQKPNIWYYSLFSLMLASAGIYLVLAASHLNSLLKSRDRTGATK